jgi:hypothetical protein
MDIGRLPGASFELSRCGLWRGALGRGGVAVAAEPVAECGALDAVQIES